MYSDYGMMYSDYGMMYRKGALYDVLQTIVWRNWPILEKWEYTSFPLMP